MGKIFATHRQPNTLSRYAQASAYRHLLALVFFIFTGPTSANEWIAPEQGSGRHTAQNKVAQGKTYMAVTANPYASQTAQNILEQGGSAVDAAIAAQLVLGLVEPQSSGIGGGGFLLHWNQSTQTLQHFDGRETAPQSVDKNHFLKDNGKPMGFYSAVIGGHSVGVPGLVAMLETAHQQHGKLPWANLFQPAIKLARDGFIISKRLHHLIQGINQGPQALSKSDKSKALARYLLTKGQAKPLGSPLKNLAYARSLEKIAAQGSSAFYQGEIAEAMVEAVQENPKSGQLSLEDLQGYRAKVNDAVCMKLQDFNFCGAPPPSSGPITVMQQLALLQQTPQLDGLAYNSSAFYHRFIESSKLSFADRNQYIADPAFVSLPFEALLNPSYLQQRGEHIPLTKASQSPAKAGEPNQAFAQYSPADSAELPSTTHLSIVDSDGNIVSMTSSIETAFGSRVFVKGFILNNQLSDFSFSPSKKIAKDKTQQIANRIQAGKRPRSSMAPMIIFENENPRLVIGSPGGSRIINYVSKSIAQHLFFEVELTKAINSPHITNLNRQQSLVEAGLPNSQKIASDLKALGHEVKLGAQTSGIHAISLKQQGMVGVADIRREGAALGR